MYFGTMSLNSSNFILPAGVSPICMSIKTMGLCILVDTVNESEKMGMDSVSRNMPNLSHKPAIYLIQR